MNPVNHESTDLTQDPVDTEFAERKIDSYYTEIKGKSNSEEMEIQNIEVYDEIDLWELEQVPHTMVTEGQILEEFMLEEEIEFQDIDKCKIVELPDKQEIERCTSPEMPVRIACEQEEGIEEDICYMSLPKLYRVEECVHKDEIELGIPKTSAIEINELPKEIKQDVSLVSDIPTPFHEEHEISLPSEANDLCKMEGEISIPNRNIRGKLMSKLHARQKV